MTEEMHKQFPKGCRKTTMGTKMAFVKIDSNGLAVLHGGGKGRLQTVPLGFGLAVRESVGRFVFSIFVDTGSDLIQQRASTSRTGRAWQGG